MLAAASNVLDVRPGEGRAVVLTFLYVALAVAGFLLAKPIRNGLFLGEFGAYSLVYAYFATGCSWASSAPTASSTPTSRCRWCSASACPSTA
jgi:hypothetical protein